MNAPTDSSGTQLAQETIVEFLGDIFRRCGDEEYLGEPVTMAQHMLQGATLAEQQGMEEEVIVVVVCQWTRK